MRQTIPIIFTILAASMAFVFPARAGADVSEVNPFIGTGGIGYGVGSTYPGACLPFGMARPGPDTATLGTHVSFHHCSGYHYSDNQVRGFSHFRLSGIGVADYGNVMLMPTLNDSGDYLKESSYRARFGHDDESAEPGYYTVVLSGSGIRAELSATRHCGVHRYTFPKSGGRVVVSASHAIMEGQSGGGWLEVNEDAGEVFGMSSVKGGLSGRQGGVDIYFSARFPEGISDFGVRGSEVSGSRASGERAVAWVEPAGAGPVFAAVGLSFISVEKAREHLDAEVSDKGFDEIRTEALAAWRDALSTVEVTGGSADERAIFATAMYHAHIMPTDVTEAGGVYKGFDEAVHRAEGFRYHTDFSLWDTFRTLHPLLNLVQPERSGHMMQSLVKMSEQGGYMPKWPTAYRYSSCMIGASGDNVIADAWLKGVRDFDVEAAYSAMRNLAMNPVPESAGYAGRVGIEDYRELGYVPADRWGSAASRTIEFSVNDWCIANLARALGKDHDAALFDERSKNWRGLYDPDTGYLRGKNADGSWARPFLPSIWTDYYVEGNARQWLWAPLHDVEGLIELTGGKENFATRLEEFFEKGSRRPDTLLWDTFYWHGNEPDIHAAYLFNHADRPDLCQKRVRWIMENKYKNAPNGLDGNDDCGTLSAWYVFSALGFYPFAGSDLYLIGSPIFDSATISVGAEKLEIKTAGDPAENIHVKGVTLNGRPLPGPFFRHGDIAGGGEMVFHMSAEPGPWREIAIDNGGGK